MAITMVDKTGEPIPDEEIQETIRALGQEVVKNPLGMLQSGQPASMTYLSAIRAMKDLLALRALLRHRKTES
jgi:hypothetical protein